MYLFAFIESSLGGNIYARNSTSVNLENKNEKTVRPFGIRDKFGYLFGDFGNDFFFVLVSALLNGILYRCFWN